MLWPADVTLSNVTIIHAILVAEFEWLSVPIADKPWVLLSITDFL